MAQIVANPPAAAARDPVSIVSACSKPGSRRCTCMSIKPGAATRPVASRTSAAFATAMFAPTPRMTPSSIHTSATPSRPEPGSMTLPFLMSSVDMFGNRTQNALQHGHADGDSVFDLSQNHGSLRIGHFGRDLAAAVDGPGMHDQDVGFRQQKML